MLPYWVKWKNMLFWGWIYRFYPYFYHCFQYQNKPSFSFNVHYYISTFPYNRQFRQFCIKSMFSPLHGMHLYRWITKFANPVKLAGTQGGPNPGTSCSRIWSKKHLFAVLLFALFVDLDRTTRIMDLIKPYDCNSIVLLIV